MTDTTHTEKKTRKAIAKKSVEIEYLDTNGIPPNNTSWKRAHTADSTADAKKWLKENCKNGVRYRVFTMQFDFTATRTPVTTEKVTFA